VHLSGEVEWIFEEITTRGDLKRLGSWLETLSQLLC
jgi:hypothetical protein